MLKFIHVRNKPHKVSANPKVMRRSCTRILMQPEFPTFCQGDYRSTVALAMRTGIVCPL